ncbi:MAG: metal-dependent transcriptional regulator [Anaerolineae bacterium]|nr:metal-dependent transcriptional regulator [Anaerolineae bacterium]
MLSESVQNYLKAIYKLKEDGKRVNTNALADKLAVSAASVTGMVKKLAELKLVEHEPYQGFHLTPTGEKMALEIVRHHRLIELYLMEAMGYSWDQVHDEAERLEHAISEAFEDRMAALLGDPKHDPHGDPIPSKDGVVAGVSRYKLADVPTGDVVQIERVDDNDGERLRQLGHLGLRPRVTIKMLSNDLGTSHVLCSVCAQTSDPTPQPVEITRVLAQLVFVKGVSS